MPYPYASGQNRNGQPTFGLTNIELYLQPEPSRHARQPLASTPADREQWQA
jgi:hypothetical protein